MPLCVALQADGTLIATGEPVESCTGYVLVSGSEYGVYQVVQQALGSPTVEQASLYLVGCLGAVVFWYVVARMAGSVANFFK